MCRSHSHGARRCPCDTSEARNHRRIAARLAGEHRLSLGGGGGGSTGEGEHDQEDLSAAEPEEGPEQGESLQEEGDASSEIEGEADREKDRLDPEEEDDQSAPETLPPSNLSTESPAVVGAEEESDDAGEPVEERSDALAPTDAPERSLTSETAAVRAALADPSISVSERVQRVRALGALLAAEADSMVATTAPVYSELFDLGTRRTNLIVEANALAKRINKLSYGSDRRSVLMAEFGKIRADLDQVDASIKSIHGPVEDQGVAHLTAMSSAYKTVLSRVRELGGECTNLSSEGVDKSSLKILNQSLDVYPSDWVKDSNEHPIPMRVAKTAARAHYVSRRNIDVKAKVNAGMITVFSPGHGPDPEESHPSREYVRWEDLDPAIKKAEFPNTREPYPGDEYWVRREYEVFSSWSHRSKDGVPAGPGWKQEKVYWPRNSNEADEDGMVTVWRRPKMKIKTVSSYAAAELTVDRAASVVGTAGQATARHEFGHRVQDTHRSINALEMEFIRQRTTDESGRREPLQKYQGRASEVIRPDGFASQYMGREYHDGVYHEVLSCGMEALFNGEHGGLVGVGTYKEDLATRDFILGLLAAA